MRPASLPHDASERGVNAADRHSGTKKARPEKMRQAGDTATGRSWHGTHPSVTDRRAVLAGGRRVWRLGAAVQPGRPFLRRPPVALRPVVTGSSYTRLT